MLNHAINVIEVIKVSCLEIIKMCLDEDLTLVETWNVGRWTKF